MRRAPAGRVPGWWGGRCRGPGEGSAGGPAATLVLLALWAAAVPAGAGGQAAAGEIELLRRAAQEETIGELEEAERTLATVLEARPASVPALLSLERVLRMRGNLEALVPAIDAALEEDPASALLNELRLRTLSELNREGELEAAAESWMRAASSLEVPYREAAAIWEERGDYRRARSTLERGRAAIDRPDALALELGDLYAAMGEPTLAAESWARAIDDQGRGLSQVRRRLRSLPDAGTAVIPALVTRLSDDAAPPDRVLAALDLAAEAGLLDAVQRLAERALPALTLEGRQRLLEEIGRRADATDRPALGYWAYRRLLETEDRARYVRDRTGGTTDPGAAAEPDGRLVAIRSRVAQLALELGDTTAAAAGYRAVEATLEPGSPEHRQAAATRIELLALQDPGAALDALGTFRSDHPDADETDRLAAAVAEGLLEVGREAEAARLLGAVTGPRSARVEGRLALESGDLETARLRYMEAATGLRGGEATAVLGLVTVLGRISPAAAVVLGEAMNRLDDGQAGAAVDGVLGAVGDLEDDDGAPLLAFLAAAADRAGLTADARAIRHRIVADFPRSPEAPEALLDLGRSLSAEPGHEAEGRELLERLVIEHPRSALVPQARRLLERIRQNGEAR